MLRRGSLKATSPLAPRMAVDDKTGIAGAICNLRVRAKMDASGLLGRVWLSTKGPAVSDALENEYHRGARVLQQGRLQQVQVMKYWF